MPRPKEVESLQKMAYQVLLSAIVKWYKELMTDPNDFTELREAVYLMKKKLYKRIPGHLLADFSVSLVNDCIPFVRDVLDEKAILQSIFDVEIIGLRLTEPIFRFLKPSDASRFPKLKELHMYPGQIRDGDCCEVPSLKLWKFQLNDLRSLKYPENCTDSELLIIAGACPNLEVLDLVASRDVTDRGLRWLSRCPNLRVVKVDQFSKVTHVGLSHLIGSEHAILEEFSCGMDMDREKEFEWSCEIFRDFMEWDESSLLDSTVQYPFLTSFVYQQRPLDDFSVDLEAIVSKFPNLKRFKIKCLRDADLSAVKYLDKVTELEVKSAGIRSRLTLGKALNVIGANLTSLVLRSNGPTDTTDFEFEDCYLDFIFDSCPNLQRLEYEIAELSQLCVIIPPFQSLKELIIRRQCWHLQLHTVAEPILSFGVMLKLEILSLTDFDVDLKLLKSIMLDCVKFPNLKVVKTEFTKSEDLVEIMQTVKQNNLDFRIESEFDDRDFEII